MKIGLRFIIIGFILPTFQNNFSSFSVALLPSCIGYVLIAIGISLLENQDSIDILKYLSWFTALYSFLVVIFRVDNIFRYVIEIVLNILIGYGIFSLIISYTDDFSYMKWKWIYITLMGIGAFIFFTPLMDFYHPLASFCIIAGRIFFIILMIFCSRKIRFLDSAEK